MELAVPRANYKVTENDPAGVVASHELLATYISEKELREQLQLFRIYLLHFLK
jgi:hypothetical protein